ncbi:FKBP-type peptidyl-prolyl cis-trans isomerase [Succinivibrio dextrinosolvens]|uniref:Peptidyl-prolyl cis-trans isomerase n=1 Tax=Succinivibrio dextrinosolvens TaxID=83771 RepID=A0A662ZCC7_9GAMM|nr:peptidylprolyl isomerase [Succinivibrio dextrinosolvens]SFK42897.1 FKBP-type peptidyl prolyl cis-trans isomerase /Apo-metallochaperone SlyD [Succinivibrio dextrinosolvens]
MKIAKDTVATLSYTVTETTGQVVGRTEPGQPVTALIGHRFLVKGLENALLGHEKGDEFAVTLEPKDTYGEIDESLIQTIDRKLFGDFEIAVGNVFEADSEQGPMAVVVKEIKDDVVIVDGNHPLAGKVLNFLIVIEDVREATEEEIKHGHAHVDGHCPSEHHHCCHHHDDEDGDHHCCHGHHHDDEDGEHHCCHGHHHDDEDGEHECCCHKHDHE